MMECKRLVLTLSVFLFILLIPKSSFALINLFGMSFDDNAFSDDAFLISGQIDFFGFTPTGDTQTDLRTALNGSDLFKLIEGKTAINNTKSTYTVEISFKDNFLFNGVGPDFTIWERGQAEGFKVSILDPQINEWRESFSINPVFIGDLSGSIGISSGVNLASIDFDLWSIPSNVNINKVRIIETDQANADIAAIGALNSRNVVPEPSSIFLFSIGMSGAYFIRKLV